MNVILILSLCVTAGQAQITEATGVVEVQTPASGNFQAVTVGQEVPLGSRIKTGNDGQATIKLVDGSTLKLKERSSMQVRQVTTEQREKTAVVLFFGRLWSKIAKSQEPSFDVVTGNAVAGVRGTEFTTAVGEDGRVHVQVDEGKVAVSNDSSEQQVPAGQASEADGQEVQKPATKKEPNWNKWNAERRANLQKNGEKIARASKDSFDARKSEVERLVAQQKTLKEQLRGNIEVEEKKRISGELKRNAQRLNELGVKVDGQYGTFEHWEELAEDPEFGAKFYGAGFVRSEIKRMRSLKAELDKMIAEGTDLSMKGMEKMLDQMGDPKKKPTIKDKKGSTADELFEEK